MAYRKILVIKLRSLSHTVLMTGPLAALIRSYPNARIDVCTTEPWNELLEGFPGITKVWRYRRFKEKHSRAKAVAALGLKLVQERYDCVIALHASPSSSLLAFSTGAATRAIHFHGHTDANRYSTVEIPGKGRSRTAVERDWDALQAIGITPNLDAIPNLHLSASELDEARQFLRARDIHGPILGMSLGASRPAKCWPIESFGKVAARWCDELGGSVALLMTAGELPKFSPFLRSIPPDLRNRVHAIRDESVRQAAAMLTQTDVFLSNDSGLKHVAAAVGTPTVTLVGPDDPLDRHPYPNERHPIFWIADLACRKDAVPGSPPRCMIQECIVEEHRCLRSIPAAPVFDRLLQLLSAPKQLL